MKLNSKKKQISISKLLIVFFLFYIFVTFTSTFFESTIFKFKENVSLFLLDKDEVLRQNVSLREELEKMKKNNIFAEYYYHRAESLEKSLLYNKLNNIERKRIKIQFLPSTSIYSSTILWDVQGSGFSLGDKVYIFDNFVFGKIIKIKNNIIKIRDFSDFGFENKFAILKKNQVLYRGGGKGDSNGLIKIELPRDLILDNDVVLVLDDGSGDIVGKFLRDDFESQNTQRDVYFKMIIKPEQLLEVEI